MGARTEKIKSWLKRAWEYAKPVVTAWVLKRLGR